MSASSNDVPVYVWAKDWDWTHICPRCGSREVECTGMDWCDVDMFDEHMKCRDCGTVWGNSYTYDDSWFKVEEE